MRTGLALGMFTLLVGCAADVERPEPGPGRLDLRTAMETSSNVSPIGLAIAPDGQRVVFDETQGLFRIEGERAVVMVPMSAMPDPGPLAPLQLPFTDLVAIAPNVFALTAIGDGFLLDTTAMTLKQHFCYEPGGFPSDTLTQRTDAIAYDAATQRIYAQPVTTTEEGDFQSSQVAAYDRATGADVEWHDAGSDVAATGMLWIPEVGLVLGQGSRLSRFDPATNKAILLDDLTHFGVRSIDGLAIDSATNMLVVVDKQTDMMFDIDLSSIAL